MDRVFCRGVRDPTAAFCLPEVAIFFLVIDENVTGLGVQALLFGRTATDLHMRA